MRAEWATVRVLRDVGLVSQSSLARHRKRILVTSLVALPGVRNKRIHLDEQLPRTFPVLRNVCASVDAIAQPVLRDDGLERARGPARRRWACGRPRPGPAGGRLADRSRGHLDQLTSTHSGGGGAAVALASAALAVLDRGARTAPAGPAAATSTSSVTAAAAHRPGPGRRPGSQRRWSRPWARRAGGGGAGAVVEHADAVLAVLALDRASARRRPRRPRPGRRGGRLADRGGGGAGDQLGGESRRWRCWRWPARNSPATSPRSCRSSGRSRWAAATSATSNTLGTGGTRSARGNLESSARRCSGAAVAAAALATSAARCTLLGARP